MNFSISTSRPRSWTSKPLTSSIIFTRFLPMSWMSPCTAPMTATPFFALPPADGDHQRLQDVQAGIQGLGRHHQLGDVALALLVEAPHLGHAGREALHDGLLRIDAGRHRLVGRRAPPRPRRRP